ncbi:MAG: hypothetical protein AAFR66_21025 [Bacteroidota bacterium]
MRNRRTPSRNKINFSSGIVPMIPVVIVALIVAYFIHQWLG